MKQLLNFLVLDQGGIIDAASLKLREIRISAKNYSVKLGPLFPGLKSSIKVISITASHSGFGSSELTVEPSYDLAIEILNLMFKGAITYPREHSLPA